jgi:GTPase Era involved in 16S rRNA processing
MNQLVRDTWASVDVVALLVDAEAGIGSGDEYLAASSRPCARRS